jgi:hypothetical protein
MQMSLHTDEQFLAAVAAALGESIGLIRRRGFHLESAVEELAPQYSGRAPRQPEPNDDDPIDFATLGIDWDSHDDSRFRRPRRSLIVRRNRRQRRRAA